MRRWTTGLLALLVALSFSAPAFAQLEQGRLTGFVTDAQGAALPGVTVTATSTALLGANTAVTETDGRFLFPSLPSGRYQLQFELTGFQTLIRENIVLALGQTLSLNMQMTIATLQETVTVSAESPIVDVTTTRIGSDFSGEKLVGIPSATDLWATLAQAPGVRMLGFDTGGSHKSQQVGYESFGVRNQNRVVTDGVDTTEGTGGAGFYQDFFAHEEVTVSAAGADVSMNTPGSAVVSTIKSGGNAFKSLTNVTYEPDSFVGNNLDSETAKRGFTGQPNILFWEAHTDVGGPIKKDKVWFFGAYNHFKIDKEISGVPRQFSDLGVFDNYTGKVSSRLSSKDTLVGYYQWGRKFKPRRGLSASIGPDSILAQDSRSWMYNAQWQRVWSNRFFTDLKVGLFGFGWPMAPAVDWKTNAPRVDTGTTIETGAGWQAGDAGGPFTFDRNKPQITWTATYFLPEKAGSHDFKFGYEYANDQSKFASNGASGPILYRDLTPPGCADPSCMGRVNEIRITDLGTFESFGDAWTGADDRNLKHAVFFQDRWSPVQKLTLTLGVRWERQQPHYEASIRQPVVTEVFQNQTVPAKTLLTSDKIVPRLGFSYDLVGDGKSVVKGFFGRYYYNFADRLSNLNPGGTNRRDYQFLDQNGNRIYNGLSELGTLVGSAGGSSTTIDPNLKTPYADELSLSFERQFWGESSLRAAYVRKMARDDFATYNVLREGQFTVARQVPIQMRSFDGGIAETRTFTLYDIPDALRGQVRNVVAQIPESVGGGDSNYDTIQVGFNKRFGSNLFINASYDYQWRDELRQNTATNSPLSSDPLGVNYFQNVFPDVSNRQNSTNWQARFMGRYVFPWDMGFAANFRTQSGWQWARLVSTPAGALPNAGTQVFFLEDINNNRSDMVALLDLRWDKSFRFATKYRVLLMADLFNVMNSNSVINFNLTNGTNFNRINATLDPRTFMAGVRFDF